MLRNNILILIVLFSMSCNQQDTIEVLYLPEDLHSPKSITCDEFYNTPFITTIKELVDDDKNRIIEFLPVLLKLSEKNTNNNYDIRHIIKINNEAFCFNAYRLDYCTTKRDTLFYNYVNNLIVKYPQNHTSNPRYPVPTR